MVIFLIISQVSFSQTTFKVEFKQPERLTASAGSDKNIESGNSVMLGGNPTATGGTGKVIFSWKPETFLSNATIENPVATPTQNTTYTLTIMDANNCMDIDTVRVITDGSGIGDSHLSSFEVFPNPNSGSFTIFGSIFNSEEITIYVIDVTGKVIYSQRVNDYKDKLFVDFTSENPAKGYYIIKVSGRSGNWFKNIVVQ